MTFSASGPKKLGVKACSRAASGSVLSGCFGWFFFVSVFLVFFFGGGRFSLFFGLFCVFVFFWEVFVVFLFLFVFVWCFYGFCWAVCRFFSIWFVFVSSLNHQTSVFAASEVESFSPLLFWVGVLWKFYMFVLKRLGLLSLFVG